MNLYHVYNGYQTDIAIYFEVIAESEERVYELASEKFKESAKSDYIWYELKKQLEESGEYVEGYDKPSSYWTNLEVEFKYHLADGYEEFISELFE